MLKIMVACGAGMGSSQIIKMKATEALARLNIKADIHHTSVDEATSQVNNYDIVLCSVHLVGSFKSKGHTQIVGLKNLVSADEIEEKLKIALNL